MGQLGLTEQDEGFALLGPTNRVYLPLVMRNQ
jgi:hypothetical protein